MVCSTVYRHVWGIEGLDHCIAYMRPGQGSCGQEYIKNIYILSGTRGLLEINLTFVDFFFFFSGWCQIVIFWGALNDILCVLVWSMIIVRGLRGETTLFEKGVGSLFGVISNYYEECLSLSLVNDSLPSEINFGLC